MNRTLTSKRQVIWITLIAIEVIVDPLMPRKAMYPTRAAKTTATMASGKYVSWWWKMAEYR